MNEEESKALVPVETPFGKALMAPDVAHYLQHLESQVEEFTRQLMAQQIETFEANAHNRGLYDLLDHRPRNKTLAQILCQWMNLHHDKTPEKQWKICQCELCLDTKFYMNQVGTPCIHTGRGWECTEGKEEFKTRDVAVEFCDNTGKLGMPITETSGIPMDEVKHEHRK